jgi:hypothetical protein
MLQWTNLLLHQLFAFKVATESGRTFSTDSISNVTLNHVAALKVATGLEMYKQTLLLEIITHNNRNAAHTILLRAVWGS